MRSVLEISDFRNLKTVEIAYQVSQNKTEFQYVIEFELFMKKVKPENQRKNE
jgi:hypothetical protein